MFVGSVNPSRSGKKSNQGTGSVPNAATTTVALSLVLDATGAMEGRMGTICLVGGFVVVMIHESTDRFSWCCNADYCMHTNSVFYA